jgi:hypothetical protein
MNKRTENILWVIAIILALIGFLVVEHYAIIYQSTRGLL